MGLFEPIQCNPNAVIKKKRTRISPARLSDKSIKLAEALKDSIIDDGFCVDFDIGTQKIDVRSSALYGKTNLSHHD